MATLMRGGRYSCSNMFAEKSLSNRLAAAFALTVSVAGAGLRRIQLHFLIRIKSAREMRRPAPARYEAVTKRGLRNYDVCLTHQGG